MTLKTETLFQNLILLLFCAVVLTASTAPAIDADARVRAFSRPLEFDFSAWTLNALWVKGGQAALDLPRYIAPTDQHDLVVAYLVFVSQVRDTGNRINHIYADPMVADPHQASAALRAELAAQEAGLARIAPLVETILQAQVAEAVADAGLTFGGQPLPPVLYHVTPLPYALIVSPRTVIREDANISLDPGLSVDQMDRLEEDVAGGLDVSALVVPVGGIGVYPTMVMQTSDLQYLLETIAHEWIHNYLTLRPLGLSYDVTPQLRTMNETTASIAGKEIGQAVLQRYYPELAPPATPPPPTSPGAGPSEPEEPAFDFNREMHITRVEVDRLLAADQVDAAEAYMETRRQAFWEQGYLIRKLNQAYFAFHGAYADVPAGAAGADPVGPAVRALRAQSSSLSDFINRIAWMTSFAQLERAVQ